MRTYKNGKQYLILLWMIFTHTRLDYNLAWVNLQSWVIVVLLLNACSDDRPPAHILTEQEMVRVMTELYIDEQKVAQLNLSRDSAEKFFELAKLSIFKHIGVEDSIFHQSMDYYSNRPKQLENIYTALVDSLSLREQKLTVKSAPAQ